MAQTEMIDVINDIKKVFEKHRKVPGLVNLVQVLKPGLVRLSKDNTSMHESLSMFAVQLESDPDNAVFFTDEERAAETLAMGINKPPTGGSSGKVKTKQVLFSPDDFGKKPTPPIARTADFEMKRDKTEGVAQDISDTDLKIIEFFKKGFLKTSESMSIDVFIEEAESLGCVFDDELKKAPKKESTQKMLERYVKAFDVLNKLARKVLKA